VQHCAPYALKASSAYPVCVSIVQAACRNTPVCLLQERTFHPTSTPHHHKVMEHNSNIRDTSSRRVRQHINRQHKDMASLVKHPKAVEVPLGK
jgi:hypothetical protein